LKLTQSLEEIAGKFKNTDAQARNMKGTVLTIANHLNLNDSAFMRYLYLDI
jgi:hypothetical protein